MKAIILESSLELFEEAPENGVQSSRLCFCPSPVRHTPRKSNTRRKRLLGDANSAGPWFVNIHDVVRGTVTQRARYCHYGTIWGQAGPALGNYCCCVTVYPSQRGIGTFPGGFTSGLIYIYDGSMTYNLQSLSKWIFGLHWVTFFLVFLLTWN